MKLGITFLGELESLGNGAIRTKFIVCGIPLIPLQSYFVVSYQGKTEFYRIPLHLRSIAFIYLRFVMTIQTFLFSMIAMSLTALILYSDKDICII